MTVFLASEACTFTHAVFSAAGGKYARVFTGLTPGWFAGKGARPTAEDILANLDTIQDRTGFTEPQQNADEIGALYATISG
jgi:hypothetical protein